MSQLLGDPDTLDGSSDADDYDILRELGRGGDGTVYLATDLKVNRSVALKLLGNLHLTSTETQQRFLAEAEAIASLDHPHIIHIFAFGELDSRPFYTMKYIDGGNLSTRFDDFTSLADIATLISKIAQGIHHAHERGILHRDLKPSNILIDQYRNPYISDFGLSKRPAENLHLTLTGSIMGTPAYMSPEQARGDNAQITTATDIFSIGIILYQLLTGRLPFTGENPPAVLLQVIEKDPDFTAKDHHRLNRDLETICLKCLHKDPGQRYESALALAQDLERWEKGEPVLARRISSTERAVRWTKRHPLAVVALFTLVIGFLVSLSLWKEADEERKRADQLALAETVARLSAEEDNYYSTLANALSARERNDLGRSRSLLAQTPERLRDFEWRLLNNFSKGDQLWIADLPNSKPVQLLHDKKSDRILILFHDRTLQQVDPATGRLTHILTLPDCPDPPAGEVTHPGLRRFQFSPDGSRYLYVENDNFYVAAVGKNQVLHHGPAFRKGDAAWLDDDTILSGMGPGYDPKPVGSDIPDPSAWLTALSAKKRIPLPLKSYAGPITISPDGSLIAFIRAHKNVVLFKKGQDFSGDPYREFQTGGIIQNTTITNDNRFITITSGADDCAISIFDIKNPKYLFGRHWRSNVNSIPSPNSRTLHTFGREPWFTSWDFSEEAKQTELPGDPLFTPPHLFSSPLTPKSPRYFLGHNSPVLTALNLPDKKILLTASEQTLRRWPLDERSRFQNRHHDNFFSSHHSSHPTASHDGSHLLFAGRNGTSYLWHRSSDSTIPIPEDQFYLAILNDGRLFTRANSTGHVFCWQFTPGQELKKLWEVKASPTYPGMHHMIHASVTPDEKWLAILHPGRVITINTENRAISTADDETMVHGTTPGQTISISPDGSQIAVTGFQGLYPYIYDSTKLNEGHSKLLPSALYQSKDSACIYNHDGSKIYVGNDDGWVRVFDTVTRREIPAESWPAHSTEVTAIALSQNGRILATSGDTTTTFWSAEKEPGQARRTRLILDTGTPSANWLQFAARDSLFFFSAPGKPVAVWEAR